MNNIIVFGASGQLGQCFRNLAGKHNYPGLYFPAKDEADILDYEGLEKLFKTYKPLYSINCAAYTAVDKAEDEPETALAVNKTGVENLAKLCAAYSSTLIHISTDFVFKGDKSSPLSEDSDTAPVNVYGRTKLAGEQAVTALLNEYFIIRTGWLYSEYGNNFVKTMLKLGADRSELKVIADQAGTPTYAMELAECVMKVISSESNRYGIYHYSNEGIASWYDFAKAIFEISGTNVKVIPVKTEEYVTKAKRPAYSVMDKSKIKKAFQMEIPYWRESLQSCIHRLNNK
jgi:dTDP-4-dehydrorhamnose reductase